MTQPGVGALPSGRNRLFDPRPVPQVDLTAGSPHWWLNRLIDKLMDVQPILDERERYVTGDHPLPNGDQRYVKALQELQRKAKTNYCELVTRAVVERMKVIAFRFGPEGEADADARRIWDANDMDYQSPLMIGSGATLGFAYALVSPPDDSGEPVITYESPRQCIVEKDPIRPTHSRAGLKLYEDDVLGRVVAVIYLPQKIYQFLGPSIQDTTNLPRDALRSRLTATDGSGFELVAEFTNPLGECPLVRGDWDPYYGDYGRSESEPAWPIQDRLNHTTLDRLVISKSQAYRQRWATGGKPPSEGKGKKAPWDPGADMVWINTAENAKFGDFEQADIRQLLEAIRDDVGDIAAITQTPATYLMNRMANVSGDTLTQDQTALVSKTKLRQEAMGWFYERVMKLAFKYKGDSRASSIEASVLWKDPEIRSMAELADAVGKYTAAGIPLQLVMERAGFSPDEIAFAIKERDRLEQERQAREDQVAAQSSALKQLEAKSASNTKSTPGE